MKNITCIIIVFLSLGLSAQKSISVKDFLPGLFYIKQSLIDHYQYNDLNYNNMLLNLESKSNENIMIIFRDSSRIIYTYSFRNNLAKDTISLRFNSDMKLIEWTSDNNECNDISSSDIPQPIISNSYITHDQSGQIKHIVGYCSDSSFSIRTDFYYNGVNELDSIVHSRGYSELYAYQKVIFINSTIWSGEDKGSIALILNTQFDYVKWLKDNLYDTTYFHSIKNPLQNSYYHFTKNIYDDNNYIYEFDSIGRITSYVALNELAEYGSILFPVGCDLCDNNCDYTARLDFYYLENNISGVEFNSFGSLNSENKCRCYCLMRINYKKEKIKEITFHARLNENEFVFEKTWTQRKGFQYTNETPDNSK